MKKDKKKLGDNTIQKKKGTAQVIATLIQPHEAKELPKKLPKQLPKRLHKELPKGLPKRLPKKLHKRLPKELPKSLDKWTIRREYITIKNKQYGIYLYAYKKFRGKLYKVYLGKE